jgi:gliding motility-associated-like protein
VADFEMSTDNPSIILPYVAFTDLSIDPVAWNWSFGDGIGSTLKNPQHTYKDTGIYIVQLIVSNQYMCKDTINKVVKIKDEFVIYFPNTFTPNDDNVNDRFKPLGIGVDEFKMLIFDRWGEVIYTTSDIAKGWDGTKLGTGKLCAEDTYVYLSVVTDEKGEKHEYKGHVNLVY